MKLTWRKSSYSDGGDNNCLEVSDDHPGIVPVRDSKLPHSPILVFGTSPWASFLAGVKDESSVLRGRPAARGHRPAWFRSGCRGGQDGLGGQPEIPDHWVRVALAADQDDLAGGSALDRDGDEVGTQ